MTLLSEEDKKKKPKLPEPPSGILPTPPPLAPGPVPPEPSSSTPSAPTEGMLPAQPSSPSPSEQTTPEMIPLTDSSMLKEVKEMGFTEGLKKLDESEKRIVPKKTVPTEVDYTSRLEKASPEDLEKPGETMKSQYLKFSEEYEQAAQDLENKGLLPNAAVAYACASMCIYLATTAKTAVNFLSSYSKGATEIAENTTFQAAKQVLKAALLKDNLLLVDAIQLLRKSMIFSREDKDIFETAFRKAQREVKS